VSDGRTEAPTPKRKRDARKKGQVARSMELPQAVSLVASVVLLPLVMPRLGSELATQWRVSIAAASSADPGSASGILGQFFATAMVALLPLLLVLAGTGVFAGVAMVGAKPNPWQLKPKLSGLSPKNGIKRLASKQTLWELAKVTGKLGVLAGLTYGVVVAGMQALLTGPISLDRLTAATGGASVALVQRVTLFAVLLGVADAVVSKRRHLKQLRMTKQEVRDEHKQTEGNPLVKSEIRKKQMKMSRMRMMAEVARADVVLTNPTHLAVALAYEPGSAAPVVVAKGADKVAKRIREEAAKHGVPIRENKPLARALFRSVEIGEAIPVALYRAVAEVLAAVYRARNVRRAA
jgi:flagellar biosynthesis protein FlhB